MDDPVDILAKTSIDFENICNGISGVSSLAAFREKAWREKCDFMLTENKTLQAENKQKDEIIAALQQKIFILQSQVSELNARPTSLSVTFGDSIDKQIVYQKA